MKRIIITIEFPDELERLIDVKQSVVSHVFKEESEPEGVQTVFPTSKEVFKNITKSVEENIDFPLLEQPDRSIIDKKKHGNGSINGKRGPYKKHKPFNAPHKEYKKRIKINDDEKPSEKLEVPATLLSDPKKLKSVKVKFMTFPESSDAVIGKKIKEKKSDVLPERKYMGENTLVRVVNGESLFLPGVQATKNKFIVAGAYIYGSLNDARKAYLEYIKKMRFQYEECKVNGILTWESWLTHEWPKLSGEASKLVDSN
jgi:hypothetical protein